MLEITSYSDEIRCVSRKEIIQPELYRSRMYSICVRRFLLLSPNHFGANEPFFLLSIGLLPLPLVIWIHLFLSIPSSSSFLSVFLSLEAHSFSISLTPFLAVNFQCETISKYITIIQSLFSDYYCFCLYRIYFILFYFILSSTFLTVRWQFDNRRKKNK